MTPRMHFFLTRLFPIPFLAFGALAFYFGARDLNRAWQSSGWPTAQGVIKSSSVEYRRSDEGGAYHAEVLYEFTVNGTTFNGNRISFGDYGSGNPSHARSVVNKYQQGKHVTVHYVQRKPEVCALEPGAKGASWFVPTFGLVFLTVGGLLAFFLPRLMSKSTSDK